jgi:CBS domain-containing protein
MLSRDLMKTDVVTCRERDPVSECARLMLEYNVGLLPVVDGDECVVGVVTDRDLVMRILADPLRGPETQVRGVMSHGLVSCTPDAELEDVDELMVTSQKQRIIVVNGAGHCAGIIGRSDVQLAIRPWRSAGFGGITERTMFPY